MATQLKAAILQVVACQLPCISLALKLSGTTIHASLLFLSVNHNSQHSIEDEIHSSELQIVSAFLTLLSPGTLWARRSFVLV